MSVLNVSVRKNYITGRISLWTSPCPSGSSFIAPVDGKMMYEPSTFVRQGEDRQIDRYRGKERVRERDRERDKRHEMFSTFKLPRFFVFYVRFLWNSFTCTEYHRSCRNALL